MDLQQILMDLVVPVVAGIVIIIITAIIAGVVQSALTKLLGKVSFIRRGGESLPATLGTIGSLIVWLIGLTAVLSLFGLQAVLAPIQRMLSSFLGFLPNLVAAGLIFFVGLLLARIVKQLVETGLGALNLEKRMQDLFGTATDAVDRSTAGLTPDAAAAQGAPGAQASGAQTQGAQGARPGNPPQAKPGMLAQVAGTVVYVVIITTIAVSALQVLGLRVLAEPAQQMLAILTGALPQIIGAVLLVILGIVAGSFLGNFAKQLLSGMGLNQRLAKAGVNVQKVDGETIGSMIVRFGVILFFAVAAANVLGLPAITQALDAVLGLASSVLVGALVILAGVFIAKQLAKLASGTTAQVLRVGTIVLFTAMGLKYMGLADSIVNLAFAALVIGGAAAAALAFGLGGRDAAARQLAKMQAGATDSTAGTAADSTAGTSAENATVDD